MNQLLVSVKFQIVVIIDLKRELTTTKDKQPFVLKFQSNEYPTNR